MKKNTRVSFAMSEACPRMAKYTQTTGEFRPPRKGEWYASGALVEAYCAPNDLQTSYWICEPVLHQLKTNQLTLDRAMVIGGKAVEGGLR